MRLGLTWWATRPTKHPNACVVRGKPDIALRPCAVSFHLIHHVDTLDGKFQILIYRERQPPCRLDETFSGMFDHFHSTSIAVVYETSIKLNGWRLGQVIVWNTPTLARL